MQYIFYVGVAGLIGAIIVGGISLWRKQPLALWLRICLIVMFLLPLPFCLFGFLHSFEPGPGHLIPRLIYAAVGLGCLAGAVCQILRRKKETH